MLEINKANAKRFIKGIEESRFPDDLCHEDFTGWSGLSGEIDGLMMLERAVMLGEVFPSGLEFMIHDVLAEGDAVSLRASSKGTVFDGTPYTNDYHYFFRFAADGRILKAWEYMNVIASVEIIRPAFAELARRKGQASKL